MSQEVHNSTNNINIPHNVSVWFQPDFTGSYTELGDLLVDGITLSPDFAEHRSYRNGINALRKRMVAAKSASITATLNEPNIVNLQRVLFGGTIATSQTVTAYEGKHLTVADDGGIYVDLADAGETSFSDITVTGVYAVTDVQEGTNLIAANILPDTDGHVTLNETDTGLSSGDIVYVRYEISVDSLYSTEIFGASNATVEGAAMVQARNLQGGVVQIWQLSSVHLAANGDMTYPLDAVQSIPILLTLQERSGSFGTVYAK